MGIYQEMSAFKLVGICCFFAAEEGGEGQNHLVLGRGRKENINDAWSMPVDRTLELSGGQQPCPLFSPPKITLKPRTGRFRLCKGQLWRVADGLAACFYGNIYMQGITSFFQFPPHRLVGFSSGSLLGLRK